MSINQQPAGILNNQKGFTLIELVIIIVILGILAAVAIPKYVNLKDEAGQAAVDGVAGALAGASAINKAVEATGKGEAAADCAAQGPLLAGGLPDGYAITGTAPACTVTATATGYTAAFYGYTRS